MVQRVPLLVAIGFGSVMTTATGATDSAQRPATEVVYYDGVDESGRLAGGRVELPLASPGAQVQVAALLGGVTTIVSNGPSENRIDLVFVGDGYRAEQLGLYANNVDTALGQLFDDEPFVTYAPLFNVHRVDVISLESGVDNDPVAGIARDTALDMAYWCQGIERLLCVDVGKAYAFANEAPGVDQILAVANSSKYGGAGYTSSNLCTFAGLNLSATEIALHELGHSLGDLADEYDYGGPRLYLGPEPSERNVSTYEASQMMRSGGKWASWLGETDAAFGGLVSTYEGAFYHEFGIFRPTQNSKMRSLGAPFNLPSVESLIIEIYRDVDPIDDATPAGTLDGIEVVSVDPVDPVLQFMDVRWVVDGADVASTGVTLDLATLALPQGPHTLHVVVTDQTAFVRDEAARAAHMTGSRSWPIEVHGDPDLDGNGVVEFDDLLLLLAAWGDCPEPPATCSEDITGNGVVNFKDLLELLTDWT